MSSWRSVSRPTVCTSSRAASTGARIQSSDVCPPPPRTCCVRAGRVAHTMILRHVDLGAELWWHYSADWPSGRVVLAEWGDNRFADAITPASIIAHLGNIWMTHFKDNSSGIWKREREREEVGGWDDCISQPCRVYHFRNRLRQEPMKPWVM